MHDIFLVVRKEKRFLLFLLIVSFLIRAIFFGLFLSHDKNYFTLDSNTYHRVAIKIFEGKGIIDVDDKPHFYRVPGYSIFFATIYKLFEINEVLALWIQIFFTSFLPFLIFFLSIILFSTKILVAKASSIFSSFHIGYVLFSGLMMTEGFFSLFFIIFLIFFLYDFNFFFSKSIQSKSISYKNMFLGGLFLGIASMFRPVGHCLIILSIILLLFEKKHFMVKIKKSFVLFVSWSLIVFWWILRNYFLTGYIFFHTLPGIHFLKHISIPIDMQINKHNFHESHAKIWNEWNDLIKKKEKIEKRNLIDIEKCIIGERLAFSYMLKYPILTIKRAFCNFFKTNFFIYSYKILEINGYKKHWEIDDKKSFFNNILDRYLNIPIKNNLLRIIIWLEIFFINFIFIGFIFFIIKSFFDINLLYVTLKILPFIGFMIFITFACGFARLRLPIEPFLFISSFYFWINLFKRSKKVEQ